MTFDPLNVCATETSGILRRNDGWLADPDNARLLAGQIAPGFQPDSRFDLSFFSGRTIVAGTVVPVYVGGNGTSGDAAAWPQSDIQAIDGALAQAFRDPDLESVIAQYLPAGTSLAVAASQSLTHQAASLQQSDVEAMVQSAFPAGSLSGQPASTLFCLMLSPGTRLFAADGSDSYNGLGGYHGSVSDGTTTVYYAVGVYSETLDGVTNGIAAFDQPWKNVVATFYHEINEWRTDPDVERAQGASVSGILGWYSQQYGEIGDIPITEAGPDLSEVFVEVPLTGGGGTVPVQLMYSNFDHGPARVTSAPAGSALPAAG
ncbi:MAG TPA: hypothetical protein VE992_05935 [Solirubrobacteraceae bacterium]|nr:hypothetical protein [Solirubrobacteraceae bacterium]